jgi:Rad3-related DNA helicase/DNA polymerase III epsilon subunit-like protein
MSGPKAQDLVAFDLETTGLSLRTDRLVEVGAVRLDPDLRELDRMEMLADPGLPIPLAVSRLVGLNDADLHGQAQPEETVLRLAEFSRDAVLVVHGGVMDLHVCRALLPAAFEARLVLDTLDLSRILMPGLENHGLPQLATQFGLRHDRPHRALSDALATSDLLRLLAAVAGGLPRHTYDQVQRIAALDGGSLHHFFSVVAGRGDLPAPAQTLPSRVARPAGPRSSGGEPGVDRRREDLVAQTAALLGPSGPLAATAGYEHRPEQLQMALAVAQTLQRRRRLLVEAGTGVGKSRAYLAPLLLWSRNTGRRAVVATHTVSLQEQLMDNDVPLLRSAIDDPPAVALLKGRSHYISLRRWERFLAQSLAAGQELDRERLHFALKVLVWLTTTRTGDRAELHLSAAEEQHWRWIASDADDCLGSACGNWGTRRCFMVAARAGAASASVVVTNHALLLATSERQGQVLPEHAALVVDEAHHLEEAATDQLGASVRASDIALTLDRLPPGRSPGLRAAAERCHEAAQRLFGDVKGFIGREAGGGGPGNVKLLLTAALRDSPGFAPVLRSARHAVVVLESAASDLEAAAQSEALDALFPGEDRAAAEVESVAAALRGLAGRIQAVACEQHDDSVAWLELRAEQAELHAAPVSVAEPLRRLIYEPLESVVLTSATLSVAGSFDFVRRRVGLGEEAEELLLASPFDYLQQALCVLATGVPAYADPGHEAAIARLVGGVAEALDGHTLVLFTSYSALRRVQTMLRERLEAAGIALLGQGVDGTRRQILRSFLADPRTVLLGTSSFWEGIDIPSERLRCVVIDKLPFAVPSDPLVRARSQGLYDAFGQYVLPAAVLRLRQGFGRLIRSHADRGAVVLCDDRLGSREYGEVFLRALPPAATAQVDVNDVAAVVAEFVSGQAAAGVGQSHRDGA